MRVRMRAIDDLLELLLVFLFFQEIGYVKESVALQSNVDECRLHSRQDSRYATFVNGTSERVFVLTLKINFVELLVFHDRHFGFMWGGGNE